jgi:tRNA-Thr(GGU) m(6)t(6)A37 methyltransferase TsaA
MAAQNDDIRPGEVRAATDPATAPHDAGVVFIGRIRSPWKTRADCPRNIAEARECAADPAWRQGLTGLSAGDHLIAIYWMNEAPRDIVIQKPHRRPEPTGVFSLRSPARPNPIALATVEIIAIDHAAGRITIDAIDCLDGTPLVDVKPWRQSMDVPPDGATGPTST